ncbi:hypothetical protein [Sphingosinicella sp. BN140058]|uniref:hypothetical protein n=1 Tax=Sphingosinicella sp. BN140058 TaxID=1892855 RepID=UPI0010137CA2|nr:hypothetical protein [Sphingosinicella sp. BN140058]QAY78774.1 hypothetical protein ETR14_21210 [Sphingosinicella sp. BN140058]
MLALMATLAAIAIAPERSSEPVGISEAERVAAARAAGFRLRGDVIANGCDEVAEMISFERHDLDRDGTGEIVVSDGGACYGAAGAMFVVLRKVGGTWRPILSAQGIMSILPSSHGGWRDIEIGGPGFGKIPVARWNGAKYVL